MPSNLRYSAARTSIISKKNLFKSPTKKNKSPIKSLLPAQARYNQNLKQNIESQNQLGSPKKSKEAKLTVDDYNVELDFQLSRKHDIMTAIGTILTNQWTESSQLMSKPDSAKTMEQRVFDLKGLSMALKAEIMKFRALIPQGLVTCNQLYSIFEKEGNTFVDRNIELAIRNGKIRKFVITNAAPVVQSLNTKTRNTKITYGYENVEVLSTSETYNQRINEKLNQLTDASKISALQKFKLFVQSNPTVLFVNEAEELSEDELACLLELGFVTLTSNHKNEIESQQYALAFPNCGSFLRLINNGRSWLVKTVNKTKHLECLESDLFTKWEGLDLNGNSKMNNYRKPFYGYELNWILADALGAGIIEVFNTPVGRGWKLTGKR